MDHPITVRNHQESDLMPRHWRWSEPVSARLPLAGDKTHIEFCSYEKVHREVARTYC